MKQVLAVFGDRDREMQAAARGVLERLGQEGRIQAARGGHGLDDPLEGHEIVRGLERLRGAEIDLVLAGALLMMRGLRLNVHLLERQADLTAHVFRLVERRDVEIFAVVVGDGGRVAVLVELEQVELARGAHGQRVAGLARAAARLPQQIAAVALERRAVRVADVAVKANDAALCRAPRQHGKRGRVGEQQQVGCVNVEEAAQSGRVEMNAVFKGARQLGRLDGNILLVSENVAERQTDEFYVVFLNKLYDFAHGGIHTESLLFFYPDRRKSSDCKGELFRTGLSMVLRLEGVKLLVACRRVRCQDEILLLQQVGSICTEMTGVFLDIRRDVRHVRLSRLVYEDLRGKAGRRFITS